MPRSADGPRQAGTIAAGAFDAERLNPPVCVGPPEQGLISARIGDERVIAQADPPGVDRHRDVDMLVGIDPDNHLPNLGLRGHGVSHRLASSGAARGLARVGGQDCDGPWVRQAPIGSRPIRSAGCRTIGRRAVTDRSMTRTVGQSSCGSGHRPPAPTVPQSDPDRQGDHAHSQVEAAAGRVGVGARILRPERGDVAVWVSPEAVATWEPAGVGTRGGQRKYSDLAIETALTLRLLFRLPLRQTEGFLTELFGLKRFSNRPCTTWGGRGTSARTDAGGPMRAYSMDLRERALFDSDAGMKAAEVAAKYRVSGSWVRLLKQRRRDTGEVAPRVQRHGRRGMLEPHLHTLAALIAAHPDRTLAELKDALATPASVPTVWRAVRALGLTVKKHGPPVRTRSA